MCRGRGGTAGHVRVLWVLRVQLLLQVVLVYGYAEAIPELWVANHGERQVPSMWVGAGVFDATKPPRVEDKVRKITQRRLDLMQYVDHAVAAAVKKKLSSRLLVG